MVHQVAAWPETGALPTYLGAAFASMGAAGGPPTVVAREPNIYAHHGASEIVRCLLADGRAITVLCKYGTDSDPAGSGVGYEAAVYRDVLHPWNVPTAKFLGDAIDESSGRACLFLEYVDNSTALDQLWDRAMIRAAATWIGRFHADADARLAAAGAAPACLRPFDVDFYVQRARRAVAIASNQSGRPWLPAVADGFEALIAPLFSARTTVVHGDYYLHNLLVRDGVLIPVDWGLAGLDLGESDLACLLDGVDETTSRECELDYQRARWPNGSSGFEPALSAARLCLYFQNLASGGDWTTDRQGLWYADKLHALAARLDLI